MTDINIKILESKIIESIGKPNLVLNISAQTIKDDLIELQKENPDYDINWELRFINSLLKKEIDKFINKESINTNLISKLLKRSDELINNE